MALSRYAENGVFAPAKIAGVLRTTRDEIAQTAGLGRDAMLRKDRIASRKTQKRLREMVEILNKIESRFGSELIAYAWYRSEPLPGFWDRPQCNSSVSAAPQTSSSTSTQWTLGSLLDPYRPFHRFPLSRPQPRVCPRSTIWPRRRLRRPLQSKGNARALRVFIPGDRLREANQVGTLQPTTLEAYDAVLSPIFDTRDTGSLAGFDVTSRDLASVTWRDEMMTNRRSQTQKFARRLIAAGYAALLVPSFARAPVNRP